MSSKAKQKGYRLEHFLENFFKENKINIRRRGQSNQEDLWFDDFQWKAECKNRKNGLKNIYDWLNNNDLLFVKWSSRKIKNKPILTILKLEIFLKLIKNARFDNGQNEKPTLEN